MNVVSDTKSKMHDSIEHFKKELRNLRTNRASPSMLDDIKVEVYGSEMNIKSVATITVSDSRQLLVTPFDPQTAASIGKAIEASSLSLLPIVDGNMVRVPVPPLSEEVRKEIVKHGKKRVEESKISIREIRKRANDMIKKQKSDGDITEDEQKKLEKKVQELTDQHCKEVDDLFIEKEKDILEV